MKKMCGPNLLQFPLKLMAMIPLCCCFLTGCFGLAVRHLGTVYEKITPQSLVEEKDGAIAIKVVSSLYKKSVFNDKKNIPVENYQARERYVILKRPLVEDYIKLKVYWIEKNIKIEYVVVPQSTARLPGNLKLSVMPPGLFDPDLKLCRRPEWSDMAGARQYAMNEPVPYSFESRVVYLHFGETKFESDRRHRSGWVYLALVPAEIIDLPLGWAGILVTPKYALHKIEQKFYD